MQNVTKKSEKETNLEYIKRIVEGKLIDKTIGVDYEDLSEGLFGEGNCFNSSEVRKRMYGMKRLFEVIDQENLVSISKDKEVIDEMDRKVLELQKERKKLQTINSERNKTLRCEGRFELLFDSIKDSIEKVSNPTFKPLYTYNDTNTRGHILTITDIHYGANFTSINNKYSIEECHRRFQVLLDDCVNHIAKNSIDKIKIVNLADSVQGILRMSDLILNETSVIESVVGVSKCLSSFLRALSTHCELEYIHVGAANHSQIRPLGSKAGELKAEDMEKLVANYIATSLEGNPRIKVPLSHLNSDRVEFEMEGFNFMCLHGHQIKNIDKALRDLSLLHRKFYDVVLLGHFHGGMTKTCGESSINSEIIVAPSFVGSDGYSDSLMVGGKAMCQLHTYEKEKGHTQVNNFILN